MLSFLDILWIFLASALGFVVGFVCLAAGYAYLSKFRSRSDKDRERYMVLNLVKLIGRHNTAVFALNTEATDQILTGKYDPVRLKELRRDVQDAAFDMHAAHLEYSRITHGNKGNFGGS